MSILDYIGKVIALTDGTKIGTVQDVERQPVTQRFFAIIALNAPWKGQTLKVPIGELRKVADNAFSLSTKYSEGVRKELSIDPEPMEIKPAAEPTSSASRPSKPSIPPVFSPPPPRSSPPEPTPSTSSSSPPQITPKDAAVWSQISQQIAGKKESSPPAPSVLQPPQKPAPTPAPAQVQPALRPPASMPTPPTSSAAPPKEMKCPRCRKTVQSNFKFCPHCRSPLFCINCGYPILDRKWKACPQCGFGFK